MSKINFSHTCYNTKFFLKSFYLGNYLDYEVNRYVYFHLIVGGVEEDVPLEDFEDAFDFFFLVETAVEFIYFFLTVYLYLDEWLHELDHFLLQL